MYSFISVDFVFLFIFKAGFTFVEYPQRKIDQWSPHASKTRRLHVQRAHRTWLEILPARISSSAVAPAHRHGNIWMHKINSHCQKSTFRIKRRSRRGGDYKLVLSWYEISVYVSTGDVVGGSDVWHNNNIIILLPPWHTPANRVCNVNTRYASRVYYCGIAWLEYNIVVILQCRPDRGFRKRVVEKTRMKKNGK